MKKKLLATLLVVLFLYHQLAHLLQKETKALICLFGMGIKQHLVMHMINSQFHKLVGKTTMGFMIEVTYSSQVASTIAQGKRAHTYVWWQNVLTYENAKQVLDYFLPKVQTPKGSVSP